MTVTSLPPAASGWETSPTRPRYQSKVCGEPSVTAVRVTGCPKLLIKVDGVIETLTGLGRTTICTNRDGPGTSWPTERMRTQATPGAIAVIRTFPARTVFRTPP